MAKPIFLVALPHEATTNIQSVQNKIEQQLTDYHVLIYLHKKMMLNFT